MQALEYLTVAPLASHTATVIFVHGLGDSGNGWKTTASWLSQDPTLQHIKWILPHAPTIPVTVNDGALMRAWYNLLPTDGGLGIDEDGVVRSSASLTDLIRQEIHSGIPVNRIVLGGFSQGGTMSLYTGLTTELKLGGIVILSGRMAMRDKIKDVMSPHATSLPIFWGHGQQDTLVSFSGAADTVQFMKRELGISDASSENPTGLEFHGYEDISHSASETELADLKTWLRRVIPSDPARDRTSGPQA